MLAAGRQPLTRQPQNPNSGARRAQVGFLPDRPPADAGLTPPILNPETLTLACGLCREESIRTGFLLSQGGEFAFVLLSLAKELKVPPPPFLARNTRLQK